MHSVSNSINSIGQYGEEFLQWLAAFDPRFFLVVLVFVASIYWLRGPIAQCFVKLATAILKHAGAELSEEVVEELVTACKVLIVILALFLALQVLDPPQMAGRLLERIAISVCVLAVFAAWFRLAAPFISLLLTDKPKDFRLEQDWIVRATRFSIVLFGLTSLLKVWNIDISGALTGVGVLGAGLAIAAQDLVRNLIAGITNVTEERFEVGDAIEVQGVFLGQVARVDLRSTLIIGFDQIRRYVPNSELANSVVLNYSRMKHRRIWMQIPLVLSTTEAQLQSIKSGLKEFLHESGLFDLEDSSPKYIYAHEISDHAIEILFVAYTKASGYEDRLIAAEQVNIKVLRLVAECGTSLAYPTQTLEFSGHRTKPAQ